MRAFEDQEEAGGGGGVRSGRAPRNPLGSQHFALNDFQVRQRVVQAETIADEVLFWFPGLVSSWTAMENKPVSRVHMPARFLNPARSSYDARSGAQCTAPQGALRDSLSCVQRDASLPKTCGRSNTSCERFLSCAQLAAA